MRLESIRLVNYRGHADLSVEFAPGFNAVVGINGSGKTTLLRGVCEALRAVHMNGIVQPLPLSEEGLPRKTVASSNGRFRFEDQYPVRVEASGFVASQALGWAWIKSSAIDSTQFEGMPSKATPFFSDQNSTSSTVEVASVSRPLVAFYRANRQWTERRPEAIQAATERNSRGDAYLNWWDASVDASALQSWVIAKYLERLQTMQETQQPVDTIDDELALVNWALETAVDGAKGLRYDIKERSLLSEWQVESEPARRVIAFENLSDGQRAVLALIADIARRMCLLNPHLGNDVITETKGVVLIDELDMHLHPRWQRLITTGLKKAFPSIQFIVATHSPQVLGELEPGEIILLRSGQTSHPQVSYGLDSSRVLEEVMGTTARSADVDAALSELFTRLEGNDLNAARDQLTQLTRLAPDIPELAGAEALLKRKELLGR